MKALTFFLCLYLMMWPLELLAAIPFGYFAVRSVSWRRRAVHKRTRLVWCSAAFVAMSFPAIWFSIDVDLGEMKPDQVVASPDGTREVIFSFRTTSRSLDWIDPSCRVRVAVRQRLTGTSEGEGQLDMDEISDFENPLVEWLSDSVRIHVDEQTIEIRKKA